MITKRPFLATLSAGLATSALLTTTQAQETLKEIRIGYQKTGLLLVAKAQGQVEKRFAARGLSVKWVEFTFGPPLLEALNTGNIDYGYTGDAPPDLRAGGPRQPELRGGAAVTLADRIILIEEGRVTLDLHVDLPRPRARGTPAIGQIEAEILNRLLKT